MTTHKSWSTEKKLQIVLEGMSPRTDISEVCRRHDINSTTYYEWKYRARAGMKQGVRTTPGGARTTLRHENARLKKLGVRVPPDQRSSSGDPGGTLLGEKRRRELVRRLSKEGEVRPATLACAFHVARATLHYQPRAHPRRRLHYDEPRARGHVRRLALAYPSLGYRRVWSVLRCQEGVFNNRKRVRRILKEEGLKREAHFPRTRLPETGNLSALKPNQKWYADLTCVDTTDLGPCPRMVVMDACTREGVWHELLCSLGVAEASSVAERAVLARFPKTGRTPGLTLKTDGSIQFVAHRFQDGWRTIGILLMATRKRRSEDKGTTESWNMHLKLDHLWIREPTTFLETRQVADGGVVGYNTQRPHSSLDYLTPSQ